MKKKCWVFLLGILFLEPCIAGTDLHYLIKQGLQHGAILLKAKSVDTHIRSPHTSTQVKNKLILSKKILKFAEDNLQMEVGRSYKKYIDIRRPWFTQVVTAAYKNKLEIYPFEFPLVGKVPYQGFFQEDDAKNFADTLKQKGLDVAIRPVSAFSTIGYFADPLLNTMLVSDAYLIDLIFHELVHLNFYFESEAKFNEAFATWFAGKVSREFVKTLEDTPSKIQILQDLQLSEVKDRELTILSEKILERGKEIYSSVKPDRKGYFQWIKELFSQGGFKNLSQLEWNNAHILSLSTYQKQIPAIEAFANKERLNPTQTLQLVKREGPKIIPKILRH